MNEGARLVNIDFTMAIQIINFIVLVYFFSRTFAKKIEKLQEQKKTMEKLKKESKRRANDILIKAERQADDRKDQIISQAMSNRERMMMKAEADIEKMRQNAKFELQKEVGEMAVELAEKIIKENIDEKQDETINKFIDEIGD